MTPYYADDLVTIYHDDAANYAGRFGPVLVTDPPYGAGYGEDAIRHQSVRTSRGWDSGRIDPMLVGKLIGGAEQAIVWGGNHYPLPPARCWLIWNKRTPLPTMADFEMAWTNLDRPGAAIFHATAYQQGEATEHPTQKPLGLMRWTLGFTEGTILDPFMGSGTTLVAAKSLGRKAIGVDREERYCEIAATRCSQEVLGLVG